jgi:hypothetical protein
MRDNHLRPVGLNANTFSSIRGSAPGATPPTGRRYLNAGQGAKSGRWPRAPFSPGTTTKIGARPFISSQTLRLAFRSDGGEKPQNDFLSFSWKTSRWIYLSGARSEPEGAAWTVAGVATVVAAVVACPVVGIPLALGMAAYAAIMLGKPDRIIRGRILSPRQHRRAAVIIGGCILGVAALVGTVIHGVQLAGSLDHRLLDRVEATYEDSGEHTVGQVFEECALFVCARATIVNLATRNTLGIIRLNGFALRDQRLYGWRNVGGLRETTVARHSDSRQGNFLPAKMPEAR